MTTSRETDQLDHPTIRRLVNEAEALDLSDRLTLLKGLIPGVARQLSPRVSLTRFSGHSFRHGTGE